MEQENNKNIENEVNNQQNDSGAKTLIDLLNENPDLQSQFDKLNAKSLETAKQKWDEDQKNARNEAEKLAKMNAEEKSKYELEQERKAKEEALSKLNAYELKESAIKIAKEKELDISLLDVIDFSKETADSIKTKIESIDIVYKKAVENGIKDALKEKTPKTVINNTGDKKSVSRASI